jgi:hypothetical protein
MERYQRLRTGITYVQARTIMGCEGTELNQNQLGGLRTTMYEWSAGFLGGTIQAIFQNNRLTAKSQHDLD